MKFLFTLIPLVGLFGLYLIFGSIFGWFGNIGDGCIIVFIVGLVLALCGIISPFVSIFTHVDELGALVSAKLEVINAEKYLTEIKEHVKTVTDIAKDVDDSILVKSNVDHPIVKAMQQLSKAQSTLRKEQDRVARYTGKIHARKAGPFSWVVNVYGEE